MKNKITIKLCFVVVIVAIMTGPMLFCSVSSDTSNLEDPGGETTKISFLENYANAGSNKVYVLSKSAIIASDPVDIEDVLNKSNVVVFFEGGSLLASKLQNTPSAFISGADAVAIYKNPNTGTIYCHSVVSYDPVATKELIHSWSTSIMADDMRKNNVQRGIEWGQEIESSADINCYDYGRMNINTNYVEQITTSLTNRYFKAYYEVQSVPEYHRRTSDINVECNVGNSPGHELRSYGPTTTSGVNTASVSLNWSVNPENGPTVGCSIGWSYSLPDVVVNDRSDYSCEFFKTCHDVNENAPVGMMTYKINPGLVSSTYKSFYNGRYVVDDVYGIQFAKWQKGFWPWSPYYCQEYRWFHYTMNVYIP